MDCPTKSGEGPELFIAYAAETLPPAKAEALGRHCLQCRECRESAAAQQAVWSALDSWEPERISTSFDEAVYARIAAEGTQPLTRWPLRQAVPVAAACVAVLAGYLLREPAQQPVREPAVAVENRVDMEQVERALDDIDMLRQMGVAVPAS